MMRGTTPLDFELDVSPLSRRSLYAVTSVAEAELRGSDVLGRHRLTVEGDHQFSSRYSVVELGALSLATLTYTDRFLAESTQPLQDYFAVLSVFGSVAVTTSARGQLIVQPGTICILNPSDVVLRKESLAPTLTEMLVRIPVAAIERRMSALAPALRARDICFEGKPQESYSVTGVLSLTMDALARSRRTSLPSSVTAALEAHLIDALLLGYPHSASRALLLGQDDREQRRETIVRAAEQIARNPEQPTRFEEIASSYGMSQRELRAGFREVVGVPPSVYLRNLRLDRAHALLATPDTESIAVADIAFEVGFTHLGRFAAAYRQRFGRLPSNTLNSARRRERATRGRKPLHSAS